MLNDHPVRGVIKATTQSQQIVMKEPGRSSLGSKPHSSDCEVPLSTLCFPIWDPGNPSSLIFCPLEFKCPLRKTIMELNNSLPPQQSLFRDKLNWVGIFTLKQWQVCLKCLQAWEVQEENSYSIEFSSGFSRCRTDRCHSSLVDIGHLLWETRSSYLKAGGTFLDYNISIMEVRNASQRITVQ